LKSEVIPILKRRVTYFGKGEQIRVALFLWEDNGGVVSVPGAIATGSGSPARFPRVPPDPVASAPGTDTHSKL